MDDSGGCKCEVRQGSIDEITWSGVVSNLNNTILFYKHILSNSKTQTVDDSINQLYYQLNDTHNLAPPVKVYIKTLNLIC